MDTTKRPYYSNAVLARSSPYDVMLDFGLRVGDGEPDYEVRVAMSWEHAASLAQLIQNLIELFEEQIGTLPDVSKVASLEVQGGMKEER